MIKTSLQEKIQWLQQTFTQNAQTKAIHTTSKYAYQPGKKGKTLARMQEQKQEQLTMIFTA